MRRFIVLATAVLLTAAAAAAAIAAGLPAEITAHLEKDSYVYIASTRKSGDLGGAAEIWFSWDGKTVLVGTSVKSFRVRRIQAGRTAARIWVENTDGSWFDAEGALVAGKVAQDQMIAAFASKYGDAFKESWQAKFREGFEQGTRVLVRYTPSGPTGKGPQGLPAKK